MITIATVRNVMSLLYLLCQSLSLSRYNEGLACRGNYFMAVNGAAGMDNPMQKNTAS